RSRLILAEQDSVHLQTLQRRYGHLENVEFFPGINQDLRVACEKAEIDTIICFDGLQRSDQPSEMLSRLADCLPAGGQLLLHVPQGPEIFGRLDQRLGHRQRFTRAFLRQAIAAAGLELTWMRDFNRLGRWFWRSQVRNRESISPVESRLLSLSLPLARFVDRLRFGRGLSLLAVATKPATGSNIN
ncbi:MAG TPA: methyltransferase domain-containing protein, partial [Acidimicrobiia bacterium]|nr:methyltransferase domain-containing protein [Acidimicrobiia bacterium]